MSAEPAAQGSGIEPELLDRAQRGEPQAAYELGRRLLVGDRAPFRPEEGASWVERAAGLRQPAALRLAATLAAAGVGRSQSWDQAIRWLAAAADAGDPDASAQIELIASAWGGAAIDLQAWLNPPARKAICEAPRLRVVEGFLPAPVCRRIVEMARPRVERATMYNPVTRRDEPHPGRNSQMFIVDIETADVVFALVRARISAALNIPLPCFEPTQILNYRPGQAFAPHFDFLEGRTVKVYDTEKPYEGQRIVTFLVYLNDGYEDGETSFPRVGIDHRGRMGDALFFANVDTEHRPDRLSLHAGKAPAGGEKWLLSQWIHDRPFTGVLV